MGNGVEMLVIFENGVVQEIDSEAKKALI